MNLFYGSFPAIREAACEEILSRKEGAVFERLFILVPSNMVAGDLMTRLVRGREHPLLNIHFHTFLDLSRMLLLENRRYFRPLSPLLKEWAMSAGAEAGAGDIFMPLLQFRGLSTALFGIMKEIESDGWSISSLLESKMGRVEGGKFAEIERILNNCNGYLEGLGLLTPEGAIKGAGEILKESEKRYPIIIYGFYDFNGGQRILVERLARRGDILAIFSPLEFEEGRLIPPLLYASETEQFLKNLFGRSETIHIPDIDRSSRVSRLKEGIFREVQDGRSPGDAPEIITAPGLSGEVKGIRSRVVALREKGIPFSEMGIVLRRMDPLFYLALLDDFEETGIPVKGDYTLPLSDLPPVRTFLTLINLDARGWRRREVIEAVTSGFLALPERVKPFSHLVPLWDGLTMEAGIVSGEEEWREKLDRLIRGLSKRISFDQEAVSLEEGGGRGVPLPLRLEAVRGLALFIEELFEDLRGLIPVGDDPADMGDVSPLSLSERLLHLLKKWIDCPASDVNPAGGEAYTSLMRMAIFRLYENIRAIAAIECIGRRVKPRRILDLLIHSLSSRDVEIPGPIYREEPSLPGRPREGVTITDVMGMRGLSFRYIIIANLNEGVFPQPISSGGLLSEEEKGFLDIMRRSERSMDEERLLFYMIISQAKDGVILSYRRTDEKGREVFPSHFLQEALSPFFGNRGPEGLSGEGASICHYPLSPLREVESSGIPPGYGLYGRKREFVRLLSEDGDGLPAGELRDRLSALFHDLPPPLLRGLKQGVERFRRGAISPFDAFIGEEAIRGRVRDTMLSRIVSPSRIDEFALCPFRFYMDTILRLTPVEEPEEFFFLDAIELGSLLHRILRNLFLRLRAEGLLGGHSVGTVQEGALTVLREEVRGAFEEYDKDSPRPFPFLYSLQEEDMAEMLASAFRGNDLLLRPDFVPWLFEIPFGMGDCPAPFELHGEGGREPLRLKGRIDRVDLSIRGETATFAIIDYKSGRAKSNLKHLLEKGALFQVPVYMAAFREVILPLLGQEGANLSAGTGINTLFLYIFFRDRKVKDFSDQDVEDSDWRNSLQNILATLMKGYFVPYPADGPYGYCRGCPHSTLCRRREGWIKRKLKGPAEGISDRLPEEIRRFLSMKWELEG